MTPAICNSVWLRVCSLLSTGLQGTELLSPAALLMAVAM